MNPSSRGKNLFISATAFALACSASMSSAEPWSFGVMADTQWKSNIDGRNPNSVAVGIIDQLNTQFIGAGVKFVVQVGDITDNGSAAALDARAAAAQALYDAGIGYYPLRGNHESSQAAATYFQTTFQQTQGVGAQVFGASQFSSPFDALKGLSYSFDYGGNARLVLLDQFTRADGSNYLGGSNNNIIDQQDWIDARLAGKPAAGHTFVFAHKGLITENHADVLFGANPSANPAAQNAFIASLFNHGVRYFMGGHDHMHNRALVKSPDGLATVQNIIASSNSYKFYIPRNPTVDAKYNLNSSDNPAYCQPIPTVRPMCELRETPLAQELFSIGYYIVTVDGPRVTVDHYAAPNGCAGDCDLVTTPALTFTRRETFGYSLNGKEFLIPRNQSYASVQDSFQGVTARILAGVNGSRQVDYNNRPLTKSVNTGWAPRPAGAASAILSLWGLAADLGACDPTLPTCDPTQTTDKPLLDASRRTDPYTLALSYDAGGLTAEQLRSGAFGLASKDAKGRWLNAVDRNFGGAKQFVYGPWTPGYAVGAYGVDPTTHTAWAVLDHEGDFTVSPFASGDFSLSALIVRKAGPATARVWAIQLFNGPSAARQVQIDSLRLTQTGGAACTPTIASPGTFPLPVGNIAPADAAVGYVQIDFSGCVPAAKFTAAIGYSADSGGLSGRKTLYNQFR